MEEKKWIKTEQMLEDLMNDPNNEQEYTHFKVESYVPLIGWFMIQRNANSEIQPIGIIIAGTLKQSS